MKGIFRMFIFSAIPLYLTSLWNVGFVVSNDPSIFIRSVILIAIAHYLIVPISKIILLPLNILTFGLVSFGIFILLPLLSALAIISLYMYYAYAIVTKKTFSLLIASVLSLSIIIIYAIPLQKLPWF